MARLKQPDEPSRNRASAGHMAGYSLTLLGRRAAELAPVEAIARE
jgi:hypothetical protein